MSVWADATSLRILVSDDDIHEGRPLYEAIIASAREAGLGGACVLRGIAGYGRSTHIHEIWRGFSFDLPIVVEIVDSDAKIEAWLPALDRMRSGALVIRDHVQVLQPHR